MTVKEAESKPTPRGEIAGWFQLHRGGVLGAGRLRDGPGSRDLRVRLCGFEPDRFVGVVFFDGAHGISDRIWIFERVDEPTDARVLEHRIVRFADCIAAAPDGAVRLWASPFLTLA